MVPVITNIANGKEVCRWCDNCGTLLLSKKCSKCGVPGREFEINSPGDIRPCMGESVGILEKLFEETYGTSAPIRGCSVFFNKVPGEDRTDEIIAYGQVIGILRFDLADNRLKVELRQPGAELFDVVATKNIVRIFGVSGHLKGKTVSGSNVSEVIGEFSAGEPIIIRKGLKVGPGVAVVNSRDIKLAEKAVRVRDLNGLQGINLCPGADRRTFLECNRYHLRKIENIAVSELRNYLNGKTQKVTVSFSGGKDSLAAYGLAASVVKRPELLFTNTGLEFPETLEYVKRFSEKNGLTIHIADAGNAFWDNVDVFGPPAKDFRWCCKVCKLGPVTELISRHYPKGTVTCEGNRSLESFTRAGTPLVTKNPFVPNQINLNPVRNWCAAEIWGYIWMKRLDYNPLYDRDFERIGCYLCASCLASEWRNASRIHPEMYEKWENYLHEYARSNGLPPEYIDMGFWRWKMLPPKMRQLAEGLDLKMEPKTSSGLSLKVMKGASVCVAGGYSMEAIVNVPRTRDFSYVEDALRTIGDVKYSPEFDIAVVKLKAGRARLFGGGQVSVTAPTQEDARRTFEKAVKALIRAELCTQCGICVKTCSRNAIRMKNGMRVDPERCISCGLCERSCMVVHYYDKIMAGKVATAPPMQKVNEVHAPRSHLSNRPQNSRPQRSRRPNGDHVRTSRNNNSPRRFNRRH